MKKNAVLAQKSSLTFFIFKLSFYFYISIFFLISLIKGQKIKKVKKKKVFLLITRSSIFLTFWGVVYLNVKGQISPMRF
jgi:hypothetical protein